MNASYAVRGFSRSQAGTIEPGWDVGGGTDVQVVGQGASSRVIRHDEDVGKAIRRALTMSSPTAAGQPAADNRTVIIPPDGIMPPDPKHPSPAIPEPPEP